MAMISTSKNQLHEYNMLMQTPVSVQGILPHLFIR